MLSDTLSARSYLELNQEAVQPEPDHNPRVSRLSQSETSPGTGNSGPSLAADSPQARSDKAEHAVEDPPSRPKRKRGRPRLETAKDAAAIEVIMKSQGRK